MDDLLAEFLTETLESMDILDVQLVAFEQDPSDQEVLNNIFRMVHTVKGTCGFLGLPRLEHVAHAAENVLGKYRDGEIKVTADSVSLILESLDQIKEILAGIEETETEPEGDDTDLINRLNTVATGGGEAAAPAPVVEKVAAPPKQELVDDGQPTLDELEAAFAAAPGPDDQEPAAESDGGSLYDSLGGAQAVEAAVDLFYDKVMADDGLKPFFEGVDMEEQRHKMVAFMTMAFGGPGAYEGRALSEAHAPLVEKGLDNSHFDQVAKHLADTLEELGIDPNLSAEVLGIVGGVREDVLAGGATKSEEASKETAVVAQPEPTNVAAKKADDNQTIAKRKEGSVANQTIRVSVDLLEDLMNMVSELVLTRNQLMQMVRRLDDSEFSVPLQRLSHCTTELQEGVMKTRMQPIGNAWAKLPRIIRDLALELDKKIDLVMLGAETELDRQVLELIKDPLTHMVRNSADHGLETPAERVAAGKSATGKVTLNAFHEGGHIVIEIKDDGKGLSVENISRKILENGLVTEEELEAMSDQQIHQFIMKPGFSTAEKVTSVSGRGVGMDVVRSNIEKIGGTVEFTSKEGKGTHFTIKIPLTLAIVAALIVEAGGERFAIPQLSVVELVRASGDSEHRIEVINETPVLRLRNRLLPLVRLDQILGLKSDPPAAQAALEDFSEKADGEAEAGDGDDEQVSAGAEGSNGAGQPNVTAGDRDRASDVEFVVVAQAGPHTLGIVVDRVFDSEEIVVKPVTRVLRELGIYSGNTILGDGSVIMILDTNGIAVATSDIFTETSTSQDEDSQSRQRDETVSLLVFHAGSKEPKAVPLALVARLEEIAVDTIENTETGMVVQYRGKLMPLVMADPKCQVRESGRQPMLVFSDERRSMGLVVDQIIDIVEQELNVELVSSNDGIVGTGVVDGRATEIIDVAYFLTQAYSDWFASESGDVSPAGAKRFGAKVLLVDDSPFFRNMLMPVLTVAGYKVTAAQDAEEALRLRDDGIVFDIIISDIEMPDMDGFEFAEEVRRDGQWQNTPLVALSSHASAKDFERGREVGFDDYVAKSDRDALLATLDQTLSAAGEKS